MEKLDGLQIKNQHDTIPLNLWQKAVDQYTKHLPKTRNVIRVRYGYKRTKEKRTILAEMEDF